MPSVSSGISKLAGNANIASVKAALSNLDKCVGELATLADACEGPAVMAISMVPNVGSVVGFVCAQAASMVAKFRSVQDRVNSGLSIMNSISTAVVEGRFARLAFSVGNVVKKADSAVQKTTQTVAKVADKAGAAVVNAAEVVGKTVVNAAEVVGKTLASLANPIDLALTQVLASLRP